MEAVRFPRMTIDSRTNDGVRYKRFHLAVDQMQRAFISQVAMVIWSLLCLA